MNKIYDNKVFTLILSLLLAFILFLFVKTENYRDNPISYFQNISEVSTETIYEVPVYIEGAVQNYYVSGLPESVSVELTGPRNILEQTLESNEFKVVTEDLTDIGVGTHYIQLSLANISESISYQISPSSVNITVEELQSQPYPVEVILDENQVAEGYQITSIVVDPSEVALSGSQENINKINQVFTQIDLPEGIDSNYTTDAATIMIKDHDGNILDIGTQPEHVAVNVIIEPIGKSVPVVIKTINASTDLNYIVESINPDTVVIQGPPDLIANITQVEANVDVSNITTESIKTITIKPPVEGVKVKPENIAVRISAGQINSGRSSFSSSRPTSGNSNSSSDASDSVQLNNAENIISENRPDENAASSANNSSNELSRAIESSASEAISRVESSAEAPDSSSGSSILAED